MRSNSRGLIGHPLGGGAEPEAVQHLQAALAAIGPAAVGAGLGVGPNVGGDPQVGEDVVKALGDTSIVVGEDEAVDVHPRQGSLGVDNTVVSAQPDFLGDQQFDALT